MGIQINGNTDTISSVDGELTVSGADLGSASASNLNISGTINASNAIISGVTTVSAGSTTAPSISPSGDSNTGIFFPSPDTIAIGEGGTEVIRVDSSGRVGVGTNLMTRPFEVWSGTGGTSFSVDSSGRVLNSSTQPYFNARGPESTTTLGNNGDLNFNFAITNNGNHYNTSNFRFTAPIAGRYLFTWSVFIITVAGRCSLKVNGTGYNLLQMDVGAAMSQSAILQLNASDYVTVGDWQSISGGAFYMGHSHFSAFLLG